MKIQSLAELEKEMRAVARGEIAAPSDAHMPTAESATARDRLRAAIHEAAGDMRRLGLMDEWTHEKITLGCLATDAAPEPAPTTGEEIKRPRR